MFAFARNNNGRGDHAISTDPGKDHCAVVRYDRATDRFTHAALLSLLCCCHQQPPGGPDAAPRRRKHVPTAFEYPAQLRHHFGAAPELFSRVGGQKLLVAVERQNARDTGNMVVQAVFQTHYGPNAVLLAPLAVKKFWNAAVRGASAAQAPAFRLTGSHSVNKTDSKRFAARFLSKEELAMFHRAAYDNAFHRTECAIAVQKRKRSKNKKLKRERGVKPKLDDLVDAALQAIYAHHQDRGIEPGDPRGPAMKRLRKYRQKQQTTLDGHGGDGSIMVQTKRPRKRRRRVK